VYHKLMIVGNLGKIPEMKVTATGKNVTNFSVAVNKQHGDVKETMWVRVTTWDKTAENCAKYLDKGSKVLVEGELIIDPKTGGPRLWQGQDGKQNANIEMTGHKVVFLSGPKHDAAPAPEDRTEEQGAPPF